MFKRLFLCLLLTTDLYSAQQTESEQVETEQTKNEKLFAAVTSVLILWACSPSYPREAKYEPQNKVSINKVSTIALTSLAVTMGAFILTGQRLTPTLGVISVSPKLGVNSSSSVTSTFSLVLAAKNDVQLRECSNIGNTDMWISSTSTGLVAGGGGRLITGSSSISFSGESLWQGALYGVTKSGTSTLSCWEL